MRWSYLCVRACLLPLCLQEFSIRTYAVIISSKSLIVLYRDGEIKRCLEEYYNPTAGLEQFAKYTNSACKAHPNYEQLKDTQSTQN